jgi:hypothetical protein
MTAQQAQQQQAVLRQRQQQQQQQQLANMTPQQQQAYRANQLEQFRKAQKELQTQIDKLEAYMREQGNTLDEQTKAKIRTQEQNLRAKRDQLKSVELTLVQQLKASGMQQQLQQPQQQQQQQQQMVNRQMTPQQQSPVANQVSTKPSLQRVFILLI